VLEVEIRTASKLFFSLRYAPRLLVMISKYVFYLRAFWKLLSTVLCRRRVLWQCSGQSKWAYRWRGNKKKVQLKLHLFSFT